MADLFFPLLSKCPSCDGTGNVPEQTQVSGFQVTCPLCSGIGTVLMVKLEEVQVIQKNLEAEVAQLTRTNGQLEARLDRLITGLNSLRMDWADGRVHAVEFIEKATVLLQEVRDQH